jgi:hypothetical protein
MAEDLEQLLATLEAEPEVEINYEAPEGGSFPPQVYPGRHDFIFKLDPEAPFGKIDVEGHPYLNVTFTAAVVLPDRPEPAEARFQRASFYKHPKRPNSDGGELLRCLGLKPASNTVRDIVTVLQQADGRARGTAVFGWEAFARDTKETISTNPRKKARKDSGKVDIPWPKGADGRYELVVKFPESGDSVYGRERIISFKLPTSNGLER